MTYHTGHRNSLIEVEDLEFHFETKDAYCVSLEEDTFEEEAERIFLPKSLVEKDGDVFTMPEWLAQEKGLV